MNSKDKLLESLRGALYDEDWYEALHLCMKARIFGYEFVEGHMYPYIESFVMKCVPRHLWESYRFGDKGYDNPHHNHLLNILTDEDRDLLMAIWSKAQLPWPKISQADFKYCYTFTSSNFLTEPEDGSDVIRHLTITTSKIGDDKPQYSAKASFEVGGTVFMGLFGTPMVRNTKNMSVWGFKSIHNALNVQMKIRSGMLAKYVKDMKRHGKLS